MQPALPHEMLVSLPKVELHVHLEGSISAETAFELARRSGDTAGATLPFTGPHYPERFHGLGHFIEVYLAVSRLIRTPDDLAMITAEFARGQLADGVRYTEAGFTAPTLVRNGMDPRAMWAAVRDGLAEVKGQTEIRLIIDAQRDLGPRDAEAVVQLVEEADAPIAGLGLSGPEGSERESDFLIMRRAADRLGLGLAVHAGEAGPPSKVRAAIDDLGADRIDHGVAAAQDPALMERLARDNVPLDVCLTSNVRLGHFSTLEKHPFPELWRAGVNVNVNTDDPGFLSTTLSAELDLAARLANLSASDLAELQRRAARATFAAPEVQRGLLEAIDAWEEGVRPNRRTPPD